MKIAVVTDSASCLLPSEIKKYHIKVLPLTVNFGQQSYLENIDITTSEFYRRMQTTTTLPTTAQVSPKQLLSAYNDLAAQGYDAVISIHLSSGISGMYQNLVTLLSSVKNIKVYPFDSRMASTAEGAMAKLAVKMIEAGYQPEEIISQLEKFRATTKVYFAVDDLSHLARTGRISNASRIVGSVLRIKPILTFTPEGKIVAKQKERTMHRAYQQIKSKFAKVADKVSYPLRLTVIYAGVRELEKSELGPVLGVHTGSGTMALLWAYDWEKWPIK